MLFPDKEEYLMSHIDEDDVIRSVAEALQYISYYHPPDFVKGLTLAYEREQAPAAKDAIAQILINSRMAAEGHRPDVPGHRHHYRVRDDRNGFGLEWGDDEH
jgi:hypothetical protein